MTLIELLWILELTIPNKLATYSYFPYLLVQIQKLMHIFSKEYRHHYKQNIIVALPVIFGQAGHMIATMADTIMVGHINSLQLASAAVASGYFIFIFILGIGIATGLTPLVGKANGEQNEDELKSLLLNGLVLNTGIGIILTGVMLIAGSYMDILHQSKEVMFYARPFFYILSFSMLPYMIFLAFKQFADGLELTRLGMIAGLFGNLLNIGMNFIFIYGMFGFPRMELRGAGIATLISRILMPFFLVGLMYFHKRLRIYIVSLFKIKIDYSHIKHIFKLGLPIGLQYFLEVGAFASGTIIIGWVNADSLAAHQISINIAALTFMMASGVAAAATIRMSNLIGQGDIMGMKRAAYSSYIMVIGFMGFTAFLFMTFGREFALIYVKDESVISISVKLLVIAGFFQLVDGIQVVALGTLRGIQDVKIPTIITSITYWVLTIPICFILGIKLGYGAEGVWYGYLIGLALTALILFIRYEYISRKFIRGEIKI